MLEKDFMDNVLLSLLTTAYIVQHFGYMIIEKYKTVGYEYLWNCFLFRKTVEILELPS